VRVRRACLAVGVVVAAWACIAIPARATYAERTTADEPQYLLSALSLWEDGDLFVDDEIAAERYRPFHEVELPRQTEPREDGRELSPHDPLLPAVLAVPVGLGGWAAGKATLAVLAGALAALMCWTAHRRLGVALRVAAGVSVAFGVTAPLTAYATQVYPELPAALAVTVAVAALTGRLRRGGLVSLVLAVVALPWLGVKYAPVAAVLAAVGLVRLARDRRVGSVLALASALVGLGVAYLVAHRVVYGGWTVYAAGDHFADGELTVVGNDPDHVGRTRRLLGLWLDRDFGLLVWMPGYALAFPALWALVRRRPPGWLTLLLPLGAGWATATWVALTMHGWWWPGRQVVVVIPCVVLAVGWWVDAVPSRWPRVALAASALVGAVNWLWLVTEVRLGHLRLIVDFMDTTNPLVRASRTILPDYRSPTPTTWLLQTAWLAALGTLALYSERAASHR
jgi:hypothetical protein